MKLSYIFNYYRAQLTIKKMSFFEIFLRLINTKFNLLEDNINLKNS
jgi:hypothetical protein